MVIICILSIYGTRVLYVLYILVSFIHLCYYFRYERFSRDKHLHNPLKNCLMFAANVCERVSEWANKLLRWTEMEKSQQKGYFGEKERGKWNCVFAMYVYLQSDREQMTGFLLSPETETESKMRQIFWKRVRNPCVCVCVFCV